MSKKKKTESSKSETAEVVEEAAMPQLTSNIFDVKLNQSDMVNYVISREVERLENLLQPMRDKHKAEVENLKNLKASFKARILELATASFKSVIKALNLSKPEFEITPTNTRTEHFDEYDVQNLVGMFFETKIYNRRQNQTPDEFMLTQKNVLLIKNDGKFACAFAFDVDEKDFKKMIAERDAQQAIVKQIENETYAIVDQINETKRNSDKIKNKLIEQFLNSSDEGAQVLKQLQNVQFQNKLLKA